MRLVEQWEVIERALPDGWDEARLSLATESPEHLPRAAAALGPANVGRAGSALVVTVRCRSYPGPEHLRRLLRRLDEDRVWGTLSLEGSVAEVATAPAPAASAKPARRPLVPAWEAALAALPDDWSDVLGSLEVTSSDHIPRAALLCSPLNPWRDGDRLAFTFRCARLKGYGASAGMVRSCLARLDDEGIPGSVSVLRVLSDTDNVATQGPVWYVGGRVL